MVGLIVLLIYKLKQFYSLEIISRIVMWYENSFRIDWDTLSEQILPYLQHFEQLPESLQV